MFIVIFQELFELGIGFPSGNNRRLSFIMIFYTFIKYRWLFLYSY
jgi:hypothetical protein